jgi:hypothetical protein
MNMMAPLKYSQCRSLLACGLFLAAVAMATTSAFAVMTEAAQRELQQHTLKHRELAQRVLQKYGYYNGPVDGRWNDRSRIALKEFQEDHGFRTTDELSPRLTDVLMTLDEGGVRDYAPIADRIGNTLFFSSGERIYFDPDGAKIIQLKNGRQYKRSWRKITDQHYCETLFDRSEFCEGKTPSKYIIYKVGDESRWFKLDGIREWTSLLKIGKRLER